MQEAVLLTGANGYLGSYLCRALLRRDYHVVALKYPHFRSTIYRHPKIEYHDCDLRLDLESDPKLADLLQNYQVRAIINAAALLGSADYEDNLKTNALAVQNLVHLAETHHIRRFIHVSSVCVLKKIRGPYGVTKLKGQEYVTQSRLDYTVFIPAMILGKESLGLNRVLTNMFKLPFIVPLIGNGRQSQHPIYVEDFAACIVASIDQPNCFNEVYEIGGDCVLSFRDLVTEILKSKRRKRILIPLPLALAKFLGWFFSKTQKVPLFTAEHVVGIVQDSRLSTERLHKDLAFEATPFESALKIVLDGIGDDWAANLRARKELVIDLESTASGVLI